MATSVTKTISLPPDLARAAEQMAQAEEKTLSALVQGALRKEAAAYLNDKLGTLQGYWSQRAVDFGVVTEEDLRRNLRA